MQDMQDDLSASDALSKASNYFSFNKFVAACSDSRDISIVEEGLKFPNIQDKINGFDSNGQTALVKACQSNNIETVKILLKNGANPSACNEHGQTPHEVSNEKTRELLDDALTKRNIFQNNT